MHLMTVSIQAQILNFYHRYPYRPVENSFCVMLLEKRLIITADIKARMLHLPTEQRACVGKQAFLSRCLSMNYGLPPRCSQVVWGH